MNFFKILSVIALYLLFTQTHLVNACVSPDEKNVKIDSFSSKELSCDDEITIKYYLGNLEITPSNYKEQIKLYEEKYLKCVYTGKSNTSKTTQSRVLTNECIQNGKPKFFIDTKSVSYQEYVLAYFADFFNFYPDKKANIVENIVTKQEPAKEISVTDKIFIKSVDISTSTIVVTGSDFESISKLLFKTSTNAKPLMDLCVVDFDVNPQSKTNDVITIVYDLSEQKSNFVECLISGDKNTTQKSIELKNENEVKRFFLSNYSKDFESVTNYFKQKNIPEVLTIDAIETVEEPQIIDDTSVDPIKSKETHWYDRFSFFTWFISLFK